jgi:hypothetical protein
MQYFEVKYKTNTIFIDYLLRKIIDLANKLKNEEFLIKYNTIWLTLSHKNSLNEMLSLILMFTCRTVNYVCLCCGLVLKGVCLCYGLVSSQELMAKEIFIKQLKSESYFFLLVLSNNKFLNAYNFYRYLYFVIPGIWRGI